MTHCTTTLAVRINYVLNTIGGTVATAPPPGLATLPYVGASYPLCRSPHGIIAD